MVFVRFGIGDVVWRNCALNEGETTLKIIWQKKSKMVKAFLKRDPFADATMPAKQNNKT